MIEFLQIYVLVGMVLAVLCLTNPHARAALRSWPHALATVLVFIIIWPGFILLIRRR